MANGIATAMARTFRPAEATSADTASEQAQPAAAPAVPVVFIEPFEVIGQPPPSLSIDHLQARFRDALAHFDSITLEVTPASDPASEYHFAGSVEFNKDATITLGFTLIDPTDGDVFWSRSFDGLWVQDDQVAVTPAILREVATTVASPLGVVWAHESSTRTARDPNWAGQIMAIQYWRTFDPALRDPVRRRLERMIADYPGWTPGYSGLAMICLREFLFDVVRPGEAPALDRGLEYARRAIELRPRSARAHHALFSILFARGEIAMAFAAAKRALVLNPFDADALADYGGRLIASGQAEKGMEILNDAVAGTLTRPIMAGIYMALGAYLSGDLVTASHYVTAIGDTPSPQGLLARALVARRNGEHDKARQAIDRLTALSSVWRTAPRRQLGKFFPSADVRDRILRDLQAAGLEVVG